jgi:shikimate kinase
MFIFLIGPSRAGKTTLSKKVAGQFPDVGLVNLDDEVNKAERQLREQGVTDLGAWQGRWERSLASFRNADSNQKLVIFDVGAGSLQTDAAFQYFGQRLSSVVLVTASFETILRRHPGRDPNELRQTEFDARHLSLYGKITKIIDTSALPEKQCTEALTVYLGLS